MFLIFHTPTRDQFRWALAVVMTRQNNVPLPRERILLLKPEEQEVYPTLIPGWFFRLFFKGNSCFVLIKLCCCFYPILYCLLIVSLYILITFIIANTL